MQLGYARVSTVDQNLDLQIDALIASGVEKRNIYSDIISGAKFERPELIKLLDYLKEGDVLVVWRLDRLGRSMKDIITKVSYLKEKGVKLKSLTENIDTTTASGELILNILASLAEYERTLIVERTQAGLKAARARGKVGGRKWILSPEQIKQVRIMHADQTIPIPEILKTFGIKRGTMYKYVGRDKLAELQKTGDKTEN